MLYDEKLFELSYFYSKTAPSTIKNGLLSSTFNVLFQFTLYLNGFTGRRYTM